MNVHIVVMAGGSGTRFWPVSRNHQPKQLLRFGNKKSLLAQTFDSVRSLAKPKQWWMVVGESHAKACAAAVPTLPSAHVLVEPQAKNTAAAIAYAALAVRRSDPDAIMVVLPADHFVRNGAALCAALKKAVRLAREDRIVTLGIEPTYPETGYGYIERGKATRGAPGTFAVKRFIEKPTKERAIELVTKGGFDWNAGMFVMKPSVVEAEIERSLPDLHVAMRRIEAGNLTPKVVKREYATMRSVSIDHGVMEKAKDLAVVPVSCGWSDIGSWNATGSVIDPDGAGNVTRGQAILVDTTNSVVYAEDGVAGVVGVDGLVVVRTKDATLVVPSNRAQDVRAIVEQLKERGWDEYL